MDAEKRQAQQEQQDDEEGEEAAAATAERATHWSEEFTLSRFLCAFLNASIDDEPQQPGEGVGGGGANVVTRTSCRRLFVNLAKVVFQLLEREKWMLQGEWWRYSGGKGAGKLHLCGILIT